MFTCSDAAPYLVRLADDPDALDRDTRHKVVAHLDGCEACRADLETQRTVAAWLHTRPADHVSPEFATRLSAELDVASGWLGVADWRVWTLRLAPVAAVLAIATLLGLGGPTERPVSIEDWTMVSTDASSPATLLQSDVNPESLMESLIFGALPAGSGAGDAR